MKKFTKMLVLSLAMVMSLGMGAGTVAEAKGTVKSVKITSPKVNKKSKTYVIKRKDKDVTVKLKYKVTVKGGASKKVTIKSSKPKVVAVVDGKLVAKKAGTAKITVASKVNKKKKATIKVQVKQMVTGIKPTVKKAVATWNDGKNVTLKVGGKGYVISNKFTGAKPSSKKVTYKSSKKAVLTVNGKGKITAKKAGKAKITVTAKDGSKKKATITVQVLPKKYTKVSSVTVTPETLTLDVAKTKTAQLTAAVAPAKAKLKTVDYTSSNKAVATVDNKGNVTAVAPGEATITIKAVDGSKKQDTVKVVVKNDINTIAFSAKEATVFVGKTTTVTAAVNADAYDTTVTYAIDAASQKFATVDAKTGVVTGKAKGTVTVTATSANGKTATISVKVSDEKVTTLTPVSTTSESTVKFVGDAAKVQADIVAALQAAGAAEGTQKVIKLNGVQKTLKYADGKLYVDSKELKDVATTEGTISVEITEKMITFINGLQLAALKDADYTAYSITVGTHEFTDLAIASPYITFKADGKAYNAYVENGALCIVGDIDEKLLQDLKDEGVVTVK